MPLPYPTSLFPNRPVARPYEDLFQQPDINEMLRLQQYAQPQPQPDFQPQTQAIDQYNQLMGQMPTQQPISGMRRFGAALAGFGAGMRDPRAGVEVAEHIIQQPYVRKMQEWESRAKGLVPAMNAERYFNTALLQDRRYDETERHNRESEAARNQEIKIREARAKVYEFKATHPDWDIEEVQGGNFVAINPQNPRERIDLGIPTGTMSDLDKANLTQKHALAQIGARGVEARTTDAADVNKVPFVIGDQMYAWNPRTNSVENVPLPAGEIYKPGVRPQNITPSASQQKVGQFNKAREAYNNPKWSKYITLDPSSNSFEIKKPGTWGGPDDATYQEILDSIYYKDPTVNRNSDKKDPKNPLGLNFGK